MLCLTDFSWGCCQTTSGTAGSFVLVLFFSRSNPVRERRRNVSGLILGPWPGRFHLFCFVSRANDPDSVPSIFYSEKAIYILHWLQEIFLFRVVAFFAGLKVLGFFSILLFVMVALLILSLLLLALEFVWSPLFKLIVPELFFCFHFDLSLSSFDGIDFVSRLAFCSSLGFQELILRKSCVTVCTCKSSQALIPYSVNTFSRWNTICSYVPFSKWAWFMIFFVCEASWHTWTVLCSLGQQLRMRLLLVSGVHPKSQKGSG